MNNDILYILKRLKLQTELAITLVESGMTVEDAKDFLLLRPDRFKVGDFIVEFQILNERR